jgi:hypothetical protein
MSTEDISTFEEEYEELQSRFFIAVTDGEDSGVINEIVEQMEEVKKQIAKISQ